MTVNDQKIGPASQRKAFKRLDGRGVIARRMKAVERELIDALGGEDALSPQKHLLVTGVAQRVIRIQMLWQQIAMGDASEEAERRFNWHSNGLRRDLMVLGLNKRKGAAQTLADALGGRHG